MPTAERWTAPPAPPTDAALPRRAMWFFVVAPPLLAFLFDPDCVKDPDHLVRALVTITLYTILTGLAVHHGFELARRWSRPLPVWARAPLLLAVVPVIVVLVSLPQLPLVVWAYPDAVGSEAIIVQRGILVSFVYLGLAMLLGHLEREAERERERTQAQRTAALEARLAALAAQLQPHFLFNSLNVCAGLVHTDPDLAEETLDRLAGFLRYALESAERSVVPLDHELDAVRSYLEVQHQRFGDRLSYSVESDADGWSVPPMLLQPLVENALLHGVRERGGSVRVRAAEDGDRLRLTVEDDGVGPGGSTHAGTGLGQRSVRERLRLMYGERAEVELGGDGPGYRCTLWIPAS